MDAGRGTGHPANAVSYTHLDVYKRQAQRLAEGRTQAARDNAARPARAAVKESGHDR